MDIELRQLGKYQLREPLGRGGMAEVWKAFDTSLHRYVAIKMMHTNLQNDPEFVIRFEREARVVASLHHPNIVRLHDFHVGDAPGFETPVAYMVMEYIAGQTLTGYIRATSRAGNFPSAPEILHLFSPISSAIDYAHQNGMIHRDIKPANILLDPGRPTRFRMGEPVLTDFGIVKLMGSSTATLSGGWIGTPLYMSPEQVQGHAGDERSDIYSLGVILYEICVGVPPFQGENPLAIIMQQINNIPVAPDLIKPNISPALADVILRSLAKHPEERFSSASAMLTALVEALRISPALSSTPQSLSGIDRPFHRMSLQMQAAHNNLDMTPVDVDTTYIQSPLKPSHTSKPALLRNKRTVISLLALFILLVTGSGLGAFYALSHQKAATLASTLVGHAYFVNSQQTPENYDQGINDQLQIELHNIAEPGSDKSYYAWLLNDKNMSPQVSLLLGVLFVNHGNVRFLYDTEKLQTRLQGGIDVHFLNNVQQVMQLTANARDAWHSGDAVTVHTTVVRLLDYLDGVSLVSQDVPTGPSVLVNASLANVPLIDIVENQPLVSYVDRLNTDLTALFNRPDATADMKQFAVQADNALFDNVKLWLAQVRQDARQLVAMNGSKLLLPATLAIVNDMVDQAEYAYNGQVDPSNGQFQGGAVWVHTHDQQLATFDINTYSMPSA